MVNKFTVQEKYIYIGNQNYSRTFWGVWWNNGVAWLISNGNILVNEHLSVFYILLQLIRKQIHPQAYNHGRASYKAIHIKKKFFFHQLIS